VQLLSYRSEDRQPRIGIHLDGQVYDLQTEAHRLGVNIAADMTGLLAAGPAAAESLRAVGRGLPESPSPLGPLQGHELLPPIARPGKILALASNYVDHIIEGGGTPEPTEGRTPFVFCKLPSTLIGPDEPIRLPSVSSTIDWELELAFVIGSRARRVNQADALDVVAGYLIFNDLSARDMTFPGRRYTGPNSEWFDWLNGKWCDTFSASGPFLVTADAVRDPHDLRIRLTLNDEVWQDSSTSNMIFKIPEIIEFISSWCTLEPGDIITTGTPAGVGYSRERYLRPGDVLQGTIEGLGTLTNAVIADD
jgi:2,4-didehydro-3-deoxy-L-rhamnonate hydrolase